MNHQLAAGVARTDITPPLGIAHAGWGAQIHQRAAGVDMPLWATALALSDGNETIVIVDVDLVYIWERDAAPVIAAVAELTGLPPSHIRVSYTHTHSGPVNGSTWSSWIKEGAEMVPPYDESLPHRIAGVAWAAMQRLVPVRFAVGRGTANISVNRRFQRPEDGAVIVGRNWAGPIDPEVQVVRFDDLNDHPVATIVNYACHPITVGPDCDLITPDYPGAMKRVVEAATGSTCFFLQGATGNVGPVRGVARDGFHEYKRLGAILGHEVSRIWWEIEPRRRSERYTGTLESGAPLAIYAHDPLDDPDATLRVVTRPLHLPLKELPPPEALEAEVAVHTARLATLRATGGSAADVSEATMLAKRSAMRADLARNLQGQTHKTWQLQGFAIGDSLAVVAMPGEPFVQIGLAIKQASPFKHTLFSGYSNIGWAYIPTADAYPLGGYEVEITPFSPAAADEIIAQSLALLGDLGRACFMTDVCELLPGVYRIESELGDNLLALHFIAGDRTLLVDSGVAPTPATAVYPNLEAVGYSNRIDFLLISHSDADHHGGNAMIRRHSPDVTILCHGLDRLRIESKAYHLRSRYAGVVAADDVHYDPELMAWLSAMIGDDTPVDRTVDGGETIALGSGQRWEVLHTPGHTPGHLALWQPVSRVLVVQDAVLGGGVPDRFGTLQTPPPYYDAVRYSDTIRRLQALEPDWLLTAHYPVMRGTTAADFLTASLDFVERTGQAVLEIVSQSPQSMTLAAIIAALDVQLGPFPVTIQWAGPALAHLRSHVAAGHLRLTSSSVPRTWHRT